MKKHYILVTSTHYIAAHTMTNTLNYPVQTLLRAVGILLLALVSACTIVVPFGGADAPLQETILRKGSADKIAIIPINGIISSNNRNLLSNTASPLADFAARLALAEADDQVKAVMITINSPGGSVAASDTLYHQITSFRARTRKPVVAQILDIGASGGYYAAIAADRVYAMPTSISCSIGVIVVQLSASELLENNGLRVRSYVSGSLKDAGAPYREHDDSGDRVYQTMVETFSKRFFSLVQKHRKGSLQQQQTYQRGAVCTADEALALGLIDAIAYPEQTLTQVADNWRLEAMPTLVSYENARRLRSNLYHATSKADRNWFEAVISTGISLNPGIYYMAHGW